MIPSTSVDVDAVKEEIYRRCDNYVAFAELSSANVDVDLEDLRAELANVMEEFLPQVVSLPHKESAALVEGVERYANGHKHAIARMFETMMEAQEEFEMLAVGITGDFDNYFDDYSSGSDSATDDEEEGSEGSEGSDGDNDDDLVSAGEDSEDDQDWEALDKDAVALAEEGEGSSDEYVSEDSNYTDEYGSSDGFGSDSEDEDDIVSDDYVLEEVLYHPPCTPHTMRPITPHHTTPYHPLSACVPAVDTSTTAVMSWPSAD